MWWLLLWVVVVVVGGGDVREKNPSPFPSFSSIFFSYFLLYVRVLLLGEMRGIFIYSHAILLI